MRTDCAYCSTRMTPTTGEDGQRRLLTSIAGVGSTARRRPPRRDPFGVGGVTDGFWLLA